MFCVYVIYISRLGRTRVLSRGVSRDLRRGPAGIGGARTTGERGAVGGGETVVEAVERGAVVHGDELGRSVDGVGTDRDRGRHGRSSRGGRERDRGHEAGDVHPEGPMEAVEGCRSGRLDD